MAEFDGVRPELREGTQRLYRRAAVRGFALSLGVALGTTALGLMALSLYWGDDLADWRLPGLAALAAIACNVALMVAARLRR